MNLLKLYILGLVAMFFAIPSSAQIVKAIIDKDSITIGDPIKLTLYAENINSKNRHLVKWFVLPDTLPHFHVLNVDKMDTLKINGNYFYSQEFKITSFDEGTWEIPDLELKLSKVNDNSDTVFNTLPLTITILPVNIAGIKKVHDIKDIIIVSNIDRNNYIFQAILIFGLLILAIFIWLPWRKNKRISLLKKTHSNWLALAITQLDLLQDDISITDKAFHHKLYEIFKLYFFERFNREVLSYTSTEWAISLKTIPISEEIRGDLSKFLKYLDKVRFSEFVILEDRRKLVERCREILNSLELAVANNKSIIE